MASTTTVGGDQADQRGCEAEDDSEVSSSYLSLPTRWVFVCRGGDRTASVAAADLNDDGAADVVVQGSPKQATSKSPLAHVLAIDGATGEALWESRDAVAMTTIARFGHLNGDDVLDVIVGGRGAPYDDRPLVALDGRNGDQLWRIEAAEPSWRNIYTPQPIGDADDDGIGDWVISAGGDHLREAMDEPTVPGRVVAVSGADGTALGSVDLPDGQETYASPVVFTDAQGSLSVVVGSGGEVFAGSLWRIAVQAVLRSDYSGFQLLRSGDHTSSFIAPVSIADLDGDGHLEAASVRTDGEAAVIDPVSGETRWTTMLSDSSPDQADMVTASVSVPAIGQLDDDPQLELVVSSYAVSNDDLVAGTVPRGLGSVTVLDGSTGSVEHRLVVADGSSVASPLIANFSGGVAAVLCACATGSDTGQGTASKSTAYGLWIPGRPEVEDLGLPSSLSATPAFVANNGAFDLVSIGEVMLADDATASLLSSVSVRLDGAAVDFVPWGGYMGTAGDGLAVS